MLLAVIARRLFPWQPQSRTSIGKMLGTLLPERLRRRGEVASAPPRLAA